MPIRILRREERRDYMTNKMVWADLSDEAANLLEWAECPLTGKKQNIPVSKTNLECMRYLQSDEGKEVFKRVWETETHIMITLK